MLHDCSTCKIAESCPLTHISSFLDEQEQSLEEAWKSQAEYLAKATTVYCLSFPAAILNADSLIGAMFAAFALGYYKGRTFPPVPKAFEES